MIGCKLPDSSLEHGGMILGSSSVIGILVEAVGIVDIVSTVDISMPSSIIELPVVYIIRIGTLPVIDVYLITLLLLYFNASSIRKFLYSHLLYLKRCTASLIAIIFLLVNN
jgi:hypothetical protein